MITQFSTIVRNIPGDEKANIVLCWHGGVAEPYKIAQENFTCDVNNGEYGNGIYFTQAVSHNYKYSQYQTKKMGMKKGMTLFLSWVVMGMFMFDNEVILITYYKANHIL